MKYSFGKANLILIVRILLFIWQLPQFIVALVMLPFMGKLKAVASRHNNWCIEASNMVGGISLGPICYVSPNSSKEKVAHELDGHTMDSKILGPFYLLLIGIPSILWAWLYDPTKHCYYDFYTERWANRHAKLKVVNGCHLIFDW